MNKTYLLNSKNETVDQYLTRAARWVDVIRNEAVYPEADCMELLKMKEEEKKELINYVFSIMQPMIKEAATVMVHRQQMYAMMEDFENQLSMDVFMGFHKFNNPRYMTTENLNCMFSTFINLFIKDASRIAWREQRGLTKRADDKKRIIQRAMELASELYMKSPDVLSVEEIHSCIPEITDRNLTEAEVREVLILMKGNLSLQALSRDMHPCIETDMISFLDPSIEKEIRQFLNSMRPVERFVFLQQNEFCPDQFARMTREELVAEEIFVELCENDKFGCRNVSYIEETHSKVVSVSFLKNVRLSSKERFIKVIRNLDCTYDDLSGRLEEIMMEYWDFKKIK